MRKISIPHRPARLFLPLPFLLLAACANFQQNQTPLPAAPALADLASDPWQAPLAHNGNLADLQNWWQSHGDPLLVELIAAAQNVSPSLAAAQSRIEQSRAAANAATAANRPTLDAATSISRGQTQPGVPAATTAQGGLMAAWEIDLFGTQHLANDAAQERLAGSQARWHDARVSLAAEVATQYLLMQACLTQVELARTDATSRAESARLLGLTTRAGFTSSGQHELARASAADAANNTIQLKAQCDVMRKALVALTGISEPALQSKIATTPVRQAQAAIIYVATIPVDALAQRPDVAAAARDVAAASFEASGAQAQRYPRLSLNGSIGLLNVNSGGVSTDLTTWSIGPLALSVPLWDGGRRAANIDAAKARYDEAVAAYRARVRQAVREVEEALVNLQATVDRSDNAAVAAAGYRASFKATTLRQTGGFANASEVEEARRMALGSDVALLTLQRDRQLALVALYRAVGGGWQADSAAATRP
jgi:outer membrane protein, multidrug efflux system